MSGGGKLYPLMGAQVGAADPTANVWLSASAGTGKTQVLTARVFRLLLRGDVRPENILCLTYTKAGATEMASRIHAQLARWVMADAGTLGADLAAIGASVSPESQAAARKLFAHMLDAPGGGLQIMTIHSFCQRILASFPAEAGLVPGFTPMEERDAADLAAEVLADLALTAEANGDEAMIAALQSMSLNEGEAGAEGFLAKCAAEPVAMAMLPRHAEDRLRWTRHLVGVAMEGDAHEWLVGQVTNGAFDRRFIEAYLDYQVQWGTPTAQKRIAPIQAWLAAEPEVRADTLAEVHTAWMNKDGTFAKQHARAVQAEAQDTAAMLCDWSGGLLGAVAQAAYAERLAEALRAGQAYAALYEQAKRARGLVDFNDLIRETARLLKSKDIGQWIAYKLDQRIEHILVDESQDTNKAQWDIVDALSAEFFAGEGAHDDRGGRMVRTLFTVGDFKQAIFGFQGTSPESYLAAREEFAARADAVGRGFAGLDMADSFRSNRPILAVVDAMIEAQGADAFGLPDAIPPHGVQRELSGEVVLARPFVAATDEDADEGDEGWIAAPVRQYAGHVARAIRALLDNPPWLAQKKRPLNAGDIMILLRRRGDLASLLVARLYAEGVPVAGVDRLRLTEPLAVMDLLAAVRFAVQPEDDLNLACLLRSPLMGWSDAQLLAASDRPKGRSLWDAIKADTTATAPLHDLLARADYGEPYAFLEHILSGPMQGRRRLQARLGYESLDPIGELLTLAQGFATRHVATLQRFLDWMERSDTDIKREGEADAGCVRVMTVHGSKGLQAPYVILADMTTDPTKTPDRSMAFSVDKDVVEPYAVPMLPVPKAAKSGRLAALAEAKAAKDLAENMRLLYVAMTRAEEHLVMLGRAPSRGELPGHCWHAKVEPAMDALGCAVGEHPIWGAAQVFAGDPVFGAGDVTAAAEEEALTLPEWLHAPAPLESRPPRPLAPSKTEEDTGGESPPSAAMQAAARRGSLLHALFERLPDVPAEDREGAALRWLPRQAADLPEAERAAMVADALAVLIDPQWADVFGAQSLAEVPVAAVVGETVVTGQVDRLLLLPDRIVVVDFKTGRFVPDGIGEVRVAYVRQMAYYAAALARIYPGRRVEAALLYTSGPRMVMVPEDMLAAYAPS